MFCSKCGKKIIETDVEFCPVCGLKIEKDSEEAIAVAVEDPKDKQSIDNKYKGLGGWLILVCLGLFASIILQGISILDSLKLFSNGTVQKLSDPSLTSYIPGLRSTLIFEIIGGALILIFAIYLIYLFFKKGRKFPKLYIVLLVGSAIYMLVDYVLASSLSSALPEIQNVFKNIVSQVESDLGRAFFSALIWGLYMMKSKRVKATFIE